MKNARKKRIDKVEKRTSFDFNDLLPYIILAFDVTSRIKNVIKLLFDLPRFIQWPVEALEQYGF